MPNHQFVVEDQTVLKENLMDAYSWDSDGKVYKRGLGVVEQAMFEDEFISYIHDTLRWLDTWNPSTDTRTTGLNIHGITVIAGQDILLKFEQITRSWNELFSLAPDPIVLTGSYCIDGTTGKGCDEKLVYDKTDLIDQLSKLAVMTKYAAETGRCIIHFGV